MGITINSKILLSVASIAAAAALVIGATFAFFSDNETSTNNVFAAGDLDLVLCDDDENVGDDCLDADEAATDSVTATFGDSDMAPGDCTGDQTLTLRNNGSVDGNHVDIQATNTDSAMAEFLRIDNLTYDSGTQLPLADAGNSKGFSDLEDLANQTADDLVNLNGIAAGGSTTLVMDVCLDESAGNDLQGASNTLDLSVTLQQGPHPEI